MLRRFFSVQTIKQYLELLHVCGFLYLPDYHKERWKNQLHRYLANVNYIVLCGGMFLCYVNLFVNTSKDITFFCDQFFTLTLMTLVWVEVWIVNRNVKQFLQFFDFFETLETIHSENQVVSNLRKWERKLLLTASSLAAFVLTLEVTIFQFFPRSQRELDTIVRLFHRKYPQNSFRVQPYTFSLIDASEPAIYYPYYIIYLYCTFLLILAVVLVIVLYPICVFHVHAHYIILQDFTRLLGKPHFNRLGLPILYTNLWQNTKVLKLELNVVTADQGVATRLNHHFQQNPELYDDAYLAQIIQFENQLFNERKHFDSLFRRYCEVFCTKMTILVTMAMFMSLNPIFPSMITWSKIIIQISSALGFAFVYFYCGELLAGCNECLACGVWQSEWYMCSKRTQRDMLVFLRLNQTLDYLTLFKLWKLGYAWMINAMNYCYSEKDPRLLPAYKPTRLLHCLCIPSSHASDRPNPLVTFTLNCHPTVRNSMNIVKVRNCCLVNQQTIYSARRMSSVM
ncbi:hypothetical protein WDU94_007378 [Cyamophila willieti]